MPKAPGVVIIARHGARLDAADKTWHLSSPTPYDPPLTYGGWTQGKALGLRIASLLDARANDESDDNPDLAHLDFSTLDGDKKRPEGATGGTKRKRRHKVVIHSSPYLRCIQTSTAIAAGISQYQSPAAASKHAHFAEEKNGLRGKSPLARHAVSEAPAVQPVPGEDPGLQVFKKPLIGPEQILLRIDAFLGEWLSPDYFEDITPPPNSTMMVAGAKADLLRRGEYVEVRHTPNIGKGHFPGGWVKSNGTSPASSRSGTMDGASFPSLGSLAQVLPHRERASSQGSLSSFSSRTSGKGASALATAHKVPSHIYDPPLPSYAVSPSDPIPRGYAAHARDACIDVDFQWDSMRPPQEWGDGGEYGDEWSTMHKRFRRGLTGLIGWYKDHGPSVPETKLSGFTYRHHVPDAPVLNHNSSGPGSSMKVDDDDEELVVVLVTHGAGCNALLGAISNQPVLLDIGLASLSMAVRRGQPRKPSVTGMMGFRRPSLIDTGLSEEYELKQLATVDHLRPGVDPTKLSQPESPATTVASPSLEYRRRFNSPATSSPLNSPFSIGEPYRPVNSALGSMRRSSTSGSSSSRLLGSNLNSSSSSTTGLWSNLRVPTPQEANTPDSGHSPGLDMLNSFGTHKPRLPSLATDVSPNTHPAQPNSDTCQQNGDADAHENDDVPPLPSSLGLSSNPAATAGLWAPKKAAGSTGLWGAPPSMVRKEVEGRERGMKRRWTVNEREMEIHDDI
ncbi:hypothetical protein EJ04DRAFT_559571 [Polyplosphaeria fusca]|uniref:Phosphoglycerate mutase n=1 Tax=Polyplosphaeria fusca TaxID=682080 RepID=A0A9P4R5G0_9PLEO|nr:hypothetical protein EJ04DRAFT_559571 [Polyplosphaeria fusca]